MSIAKTLYQHWQSSDIELRTPWEEASPSLRAVFEGKEKAIIAQYPEAEHLLRIDDASCSCGDDFYDTRGSMANIIQLQVAHLNYVLWRRYASSDL